MTPLYVNRADLAWALAAVLPHVGDKNKELDWIGIAEGLTIFATDGLTVALACAPIMWERVPKTYLSPSEAKDLLRFVKPTLKAHHEQDVTLLVTETELHVSCNEESEVYELRSPGAPLEELEKMIRFIKSQPVETDSSNLIYWPALLPRFAKAARDETDRMRIYPVKGTALGGASIITVGDNFIAAIRGMSLDDVDMNAQIERWIAA